MKILYRYRESHYADGGIYCEKYNIVKVTPKGAWIELYPGKNRFVKNDSKKKYASTTEYLALNDFIARKKRQIKILSAMLDYAKSNLEIGQSKLGGSNERNN